MLNSTQPSWIPDDIWNFSIQKLNQLSLGSDDHDTMLRLIDSKNETMKAAFNSLKNNIEESKRQLVVFEKLWDLVIYVEMLQPIPQSEYKKYWNKNADLALELADITREPPSSDLIMPSWHNDLLPLLKKAIDDYGISVPIDVFDSDSKQLKPFPSLQQILTSYAEMATAEANKKPTFHTFNEMGAVPHKKIGKDGKLAKQLFFVDSLKIVINEETKEKLYQTVADFTNVVFDLNCKWDSDNVRKLSAPES